MKNPKQQPIAFNFIAAQWSDSHKVKQSSVTDANVQEWFGK